jgi:hypothetical protein
VEVIYHPQQNIVSVFLFAYPKNYSQQHQNQQYILFPLTKKKRKNKKKLETLIQNTFKEKIRRLSLTYKV